jgi:hypothetical protein
MDHARYLVYGTVHGEYPEIPAYLAVKYCLGLATSLGTGSLIRRFQDADLDMTRTKQAPG